MTPQTDTKEKIDGLLRTLDNHARSIIGTQVTPLQPIMNPIAQALSEYRGSVPAPQWLETGCGQLRSHPVFAYLHQDPYSSYGFRKPRGYPGDAVLMDFMYGGGASVPFVQTATPLGAAMYRECSHHPSFAAIRGRRDYLSGRLLQLCQADRGAHILSVACGHLREALPLHGVADFGRRGRLVALDQDLETLQVVRAEQSCAGIELIHSSILNLIRAGQEIGSFDFIYSAGLYDYLSDDVAVRLLVKLVSMLKPGGRLLIANMLPDLPVAAYMESVMDWWLIYRTERQMQLLADRLNAIAPNQTIHIHTQPFVVYLEIGGQR